MRVGKRLLWSLVLLASLMFVPSLSDPVAQPENPPLAPEAPVNPPETPNETPTNTNTNIAPRGVVDLTAETFMDAVKDSNWLILHYSPMCPHCVQYMPWYLGFAKEQAKAQKDPSKLQFKIGRVDCVKYWQELCGNLNVEYFPDLKLYHNNYQTEFSGERTSSEELLGQASKFFTAPEGTGVRVILWDAQVGKYTLKQAESRQPSATAKVMTAVANRDWRVIALLAAGIFNLSVGIFFCVRYMTRIEGTRQNSPKQLERSELLDMHVELPPQQAMPLNRRPPLAD